MLASQIGLAQVRVTYKVDTGKLSPAEKENEIARWTKEMEDEFVFYLDVKGAKSHFYLEDYMPPEDGTNKKFYKNLAIVSSTGALEFWMDKTAGKRVVKQSREKVSYDLVRTDWQITSETKKIDKYDCFKAFYNHKITVRNGEEHILKVVAWFAPELPYAFGPSEYFGLPGLILELDNNNGSVFQANSISLSEKIRDIELPKDTVSAEEHAERLKASMEEVRWKK